MPKHRLSRRRRIAAAATALAAGGVLIVAQNDAPAAATDPVGLNAVYEYLGWGDPQDPVEVMKATGIRQFTLAFLLAGHGCEPAWDGQRALSGDKEEAKIKAIRAAGGDVVASFGGWDGDKLGEKCADAGQLAAAYQKVIDAYQLKAIDIDIENTELSGAESRQRVVDALKAVKTANPGLKVYVTFSSEEHGPDADGTDLITKAAKASLEVDGWVVMPFDFDRHDGTMVDATESAVTGLQQALVKAYGYDQDTAWRHSGLSSINGHSDSPDEVVSPADFQAVRDFAAAHHLARFTFWAVNRDRSCAGAFSKDAASSCGGIQQSPYEFTRIVAGYHADSTPSGTATHCPDPVPTATIVASTTTGPADDDDTASPSPTPRRDAETRTPISGTPVSPQASASQSRRLAQAEARRGKTATPTEDSGGSGDSDGSGDDTPEPKVTTAQPADPAESPSPARPKKTPKPTTPPASPESGSPSAPAPSGSPTKHHASPTTTTTGAPVTGTLAPAADCGPTAGPTDAPVVTPSATATPVPTGQPTTARPTPQQPTPTRTPAPVPTTETPSPAVTPTTTATPSSAVVPTATATTPVAAAAAAAPTATPTGDPHGQPLASTGGGDATSVIVAGAGALLLIGGAFGMVGTRRRRTTED
ncbi:hypothetical protein ACGF12_22360 [Kitasatospora sp. NPDC048296]|uniref:chitinase n=1 Tax=Kitasatospora sp. NPDC048296 TaxID=3364048 RepID=UPI0037221C61